MTKMLFVYGCYVVVAILLWYIFKHYVYNAFSNDEILTTQKEFMQNVINIPQQLWNEQNAVAADGSAFQTEILI